jgi:dihydrofolate reductase
MFKIIAAVSTNGVIGIGDELPWKIPADLKKFKELTAGQRCIMGSKTFESMKRYFKGEVLPGRVKYVVSRDTSKQFENATTVSLEQAKELGKEHDIFVIGGGQIYDAFFDLTEEIYLTNVHIMIPVDKNVTFFEHVRDWKMRDFNLRSVETLPDNNYDANLCHFIRERK